MKPAVGSEDAPPEGREPRGGSEEATGLQELA
jgi:hypothetical protein